MRTDVSGRPLELRDLDLTRFFSPGVVAVVGATDSDGKQNTGIWRRLRSWADESGAEIWPVHPSKASIDGVRAVPSLSDVPTEIDLAVILVADVETAVEQAIDKGVRFAVVFASGFAEQGGEGAERQQRLTDLVRGSDLNLLGPNTNLNTFEHFRDDLPRPSIGLITQSGHQGRPIFQAQEIGIPLTAWAPTGNEGDLEFADFVRWFTGDPEIGVIAAYVESFRDARTMRLAADGAMTAGVPLVCVKVGRTPEGSSMALSHTGKLTGADDVVDAAFRQHGVVRVDGLDQLIDTAQVLLRRPNGPTAEGVVVYSISGGTGAHMSDLCARAGLQLPDLGVETQENLRKVIPTYLRVSNPVDSGGNGAGDDRGRYLLDTLLSDPEIGVVICPITGAFAPMSDRLAQDLVDAAEHTDKLICVIWGSPAADEPAYRQILLNSSQIAVFRTFGNCVNAVKAWIDWHRFQSAYQSPFSDTPQGRSKSASAAREVLAAKGRSLTEHDAKGVLSCYGISVTAEQVVDSETAAVLAASEIGGDSAVVMKIVSGEVQHKSDIGGVRTGVVGNADVRQAFRVLADLGDGTVLVSEQISDAVAELIVGVTQDQVFGPTVTLGLGGIHAEITADAVVRVPPFGRNEVHRMLDELHGVRLLRGARGRPSADEESVVDVVMAVQRMALELEAELEEFAINPLLVRPQGCGAVAADAMAVRSTYP
jgi:acyl-CoA synthetase (NDP forming)